MARLVKIVAGIIALFMLAFAAIIIYAMVSDYKPRDKEILVSDSTITPDLHDSSVVDIIIWNLGYAGLDKEMDFFYDGGLQVRPPKERFGENFKRIKETIVGFDTVDLILLQEIDVKSKRSYHVNEVDAVRAEMNGFEAAFGKNYDVFFVPVPLKAPMGSVHSGIFTLSKLKPSLVVRYSFPGKYPFPKQLFMLDRCFVVTHIPVANGKELLVINTHNEAYDKGNIRDAQMGFLRDYVIAEFDKGNYVVVGGDWNQCPPGFVPQFSGEIFDSENNKTIPVDYLTKDWQWVYDAVIPTNRRVDQVYEKGRTSTTLIDFFLLSPNVKPLMVEAIDLHFEHSDHNPVYLSIELN